ncbi:LOW QUALITY PROTEIN: cadherin 86C [Amblyomma americanum]
MGLAPAGAAGDSVLRLTPWRWEARRKRTTRSARAESAYGAGGFESWSTLEESCSSQRDRRRSRHRRCTAAMWLCMLLLLDIGNVEGNAPNIDYSHNMRVLKLPKETPIGTIVYRLKGSDADSDVLTFGAQDAVGKALFQFRSVQFSQADVILKKALTEEEYTIQVFVTDGVETTEVESTIIVTNGTGLPHPFVDYSTLLRVPENTKVNSSIGYVTARERENSNLPVTFELRGSDKFKIRYEFGPRGTSKAVIQLIELLDYETRKVYELDVLALNAWTDERYDTRNVAMLSLAVVAQDVPDTPPRFHNVPPVVTVSDSAPPGTSVLNLTAEDGDYGNPRNLTYRLDKENPWSSHFTVNPQTGEVKTTRPISELADKYGGTAVYILKVAARESSGTAEYPAQEASTQLAVVLMSRENHPPAFASEVYAGFVAEHSAPSTAVQWAPGVMAKVYDRDQGRNSTFRLYLEGEAASVFSIHPQSASREADFAILVQDSSKLDYEVANPKYVEFMIVAAETEAVQPLTSSVAVRVNIADTNDHAPMFTSDMYEVVVAEDAKPGTVIAAVTATDPDTGSFGTIKYTSLNGPIARNLKLDADTGQVTLLSSEGLDRESVPEYALTVEAQDGGGRRASTQLLVRLGDANDNAPSFRQPRYDAVLTADLADFAEPLIVQVPDADAPGPNSNVTYEIVSGNYEQKFRINPVSGALSLSAPLSAQRGARAGLPLVLTVRAHDQGIPVRSASVPVRVHTQEYLNRSIVVVLPGSEDQVRPRKENIERGLSDLLGANVNIYSIMPHNGSKNATVARAWAVYESQPIDLVSFGKIMSNLYGKNYEQISVERETLLLKRSGNDRVFWILLIVLILIILLLLLIMLCCCWKYFLRNQRPRSSSKVSPSASAGAATTDQSVRERRSTTDKASTAVNGSVPSGRRGWQGDGGSPRPADGSVPTQSVAVGTTAGADEAARQGGTVENPPRGRPASRERLVLHGSSLDTDAVVHAGEGGGHRLGDFLVVRRDAAAARRRRRDEGPDSDAEPYRRAPSSPVSDTFGTTRSVEYSGGSLGGVGGPRRTEILYIRSPPPDVASVAGDYQEDSSSRRWRRLREEEADDSGNIRHRAAANRRENARRVRFSRYHKVDGASFVLQSHSPDGVEDATSSTSGLPRDQVWIVPQEPRGAAQRDAVRYEEPAGRPIPAARNARLRAMHRRIGVDSEELGTSDFGESFEECELRSKNILANDLPQVHGGEADGPSFSRVAESSFQDRSRGQQGTATSGMAGVPPQVFQVDATTAVQQQIRTSQIEDRSVQAGESVQASSVGSHAALVPVQSTDLTEQTSSLMVPQRKAAVSSGTSTQTTTLTTRTQQQQSQLDSSVASPSLATNISGPSISEAPVSFTHSDGSAARFSDTVPTDPANVSTVSHVAQVHHIQQEGALTQSHIQSTLQSLGLQGPQLVAITGMSPVFFSTQLPGTQVISQPLDIAHPSYPRTTVHHQPSGSAPTHYSTEQTTHFLHPRDQVPHAPSHLSESKQDLISDRHEQAGTPSLTTEGRAGTLSQDRISHSNLVEKVSATAIKENQEGSAVRGPTTGPVPSATVHDESNKARFHVPLSVRASGHTTEAEETPTHQRYSTLKITTKVITTDGSILHEGSATQTGAASDSELEAIERELKTSLGKLDESGQDDSDSGIGAGAKNLRLKKNAFIEKKSLFTIAYDGVNTERIRTCLGSSSPSP